MSPLLLLSLLAGCGELSADFDMVGDWTLTRYGGDEIPFVEVHDDCEVTFTISRPLAITAAVDGGFVGEGNGWEDIAQTPEDCLYFGISPAWPEALELQVTSDLTISATAVNFEQDLGELFFCQGSGDELTCTENAEDATEHVFVRD